MGEGVGEESRETVVDGVRDTSEGRFFALCLAVLEFVLPGGRPRRLPVPLLVILDDFGRGGEKAGCGRLRCAAVGIDGAMAQQTADQSCLEGAFRSAGPRLLYLRSLVEITILVVGFTAA